MPKIFHQPLSPWLVTQSFGDNLVCVNADRQVVSCDGTNPPPGFWSLYGPAGHLGMDARVLLRGQEVYCAQAGIVEYVDTQARSGLDVRIVSEIDGKKYRHIYEHLLGYSPKVGDYIETGQLIGWADNTGYSSGDHLHFQLEVWLDGIWVAIDPAPLMSGLFAKDVLYMNHKLLYLKEQVAMLLDNFAAYLRLTKGGTS